MPEMEKLTLQTNVWQQIALKWADGKEVEGRYGPQVRYTLTDGRALYVPPIVKEKIDMLGLVAGEEFNLRKAEVKEGNRKGVEYQVHRISPATPREVAPSREAELQAGPSARNTANQVQHSAAPVQKYSHGDQMLAAGMTAVNVLKAVSRYAREQGMGDPEFNGEDIRNVMVSLFIQGARQW